MGIPILNHSLPQGVLVGLKIQPPFWTLLCVPSLLDMVLIILALRTLVNLSLLYISSIYQVIHGTTLKCFVIILAIQYVMLLSDGDFKFP